MTDLMRYSELVIRQQVEQLEIFTPFETANRYSIHTSDGAQLMYAYEESGNMSRQFAGSHRALSMHVVDGNNKPCAECESRLLLVSAPTCGSAWTVDKSEP